MSIDTIDAKARVYAERRQHLQEQVTSLNDAMHALQREHLRGIKRSLARTFEAEAELRALIEANADLFVKPRTVVMHGVRVGFEKGKGRIDFADADLVVRAIEKKLPDLADVLIRETKEPVKKALAQLSVAQLKSIGCEVQEAGDRVVVRAVDTVVDKLVAALLKGLESEAEHEAVAEVE